MPRIVLIDGRFEVLNGPEKIEVYDMRNLNRDAEGRVQPVMVLPVPQTKSDKDAGKLALEKLQQAGHISTGQYLSFLETFLASVRPDGSAFRNPPAT
jgi:hypothetical protein